MPSQSVWPAYVANLRARLECDVCMLVLTASDSVARWAAKTVRMGGSNHFTPFVLGPAGVPVVTDEDQARAYPELAVLSAMAHGNDANVDTAVRIAIAARSAIVHLDDDRSQLYNDLVLSSLNEAARSALQTMEPKNYQYQSDFARHYHSQGIAEGRAEGEQNGRAALMIQLLEMRFGPMGSDTRHVIATAPASELDAIVNRLFTATTLRDALAG